MVRRGEQSVLVFLDVSESIASLELKQLIQPKILKLLTRRETGSRFLQNKPLSTTIEIDVWPVYLLCSYAFCKERPNLSSPGPQQVAQSQLRLVYINILKTFFFQSALFRA